MGAKGKGARHVFHAELKKNSGHWRVLDERKGVPRDKRGNIGGGLKDGGKRAPSVSKGH